jgi:ribosomal protein L29
MDLGQLRQNWNAVLDRLESIDRIAWISFFDARLAEFDGQTLRLDFSDSRKFGSAHEYSEVRTRQIATLKTVIHEVLGIDVEIVLE